jgi:NADH-quinone oxidoreductase subunit M
MVAIVFLGLFPKLLLDRINPSVERTNSVVRTQDPPPTVVPAAGVVTLTSSVSGSNQ